MNGDKITQQGIFGIGVNKGTVTETKISQKIEGDQLNELQQVKGIVQDLEAFVSELIKNQASGVDPCSAEFQTVALRALSDHPDLKTRIVGSLQKFGYEVMTELTASKAAEGILAAIAAIVA